MGFTVGFNTLNTQEICREHVEVVKNVLITFITKMHCSIGFIRCSLDVAELASDEFSIFPRSIQHVATV